MNAGEHEKAVAAARDEGFKAGKIAGVAEAIENLNAIMALDEAKGRELQAIVAFTVGLDATGAKAMLSVSPKPRSFPSLEERMRSEGEAVGAPEIGGLGSGPQEAATRNSWSKAVASANQRFA
jgi:hypothetical protein